MKLTHLYKPADSLKENVSQIVTITFPIRPTVTYTFVLSKLGIDGRNQPVYVGNCEVHDSEDDSTHHMYAAVVFRLDGSLCAIRASFTMDTAKAAGILAITEKRVVYSNTSAVDGWESYRHGEAKVEGYIPEQLTHCEGTPMKLQHLSEKVSQVITVTFPFQPTITYTFVLHKVGINPTGKPVYYGNCEVHDSEDDHTENMFAAVLFRTDGSLFVVKFVTSAADAESLASKALSTRYKFDGWTHYRGGETKVEGYIPEQQSSLGKLLKEEQVDMFKLLLQVHDELGIKHAWKNKSALTSQDVSNAVAMMNSSAKNKDMNSSSGPVWPLEKVADSFKVLNGRSFREALHAGVSGLRQLQPLDGFIPAQFSMEIQKALDTIGANATYVQAHAEQMHSIITGILLVVKDVAGKSAYEKSIATATLKKLGLKI